MKYFWIALGGSLGALLRYGLSGIFQNLINSDFPLGTLSVNLIGAFVIGFFWTAVQSRIEPFPHFNLFLFTGIIGAFTTFSTYTLETLNLVRINEWKLALWNIFLTNILGLLLVFAGIVSFQFIVKLFK